MQQCMMLPCFEKRATFAEALYLSTWETQAHWFELMKRVQPDMCSFMVKHCMVSSQA